MVIRAQFNRTMRWSPCWRLDDAPLVFADLETTGLYPERDQRITEVALVDRGGLRLHRIAREAAGFGGAVERDVLGEVSELLDGVVVVGHNILFDLRFFQQRFERHQLRLPPVGFIDTLRLSRIHLNLSDHRLGSVAEHLELELPDELHRADNDARLAQRVFERLVDKAELSTLADADVQRFTTYDDHF